MTWEALSIKVHFQFICKESFKFFQIAKCHQFYVISKSLVITMTYRTVMSAYWSMCNRIGIENSLN